MKTMYPFQLLILTILFTTCHPATNLEIIQIQRQPLPGISSASGIGICPDGLYVAGDDTPHLYRLGKDFQIIESIRIHEAQADPESGRIPKAVKPDIEAVAVQTTSGGTRLFLFGSGSKSPERNKLVVVGPEPQRPVQRYDLSAFYERIREAAGLEIKDFNLEGAVIHAGTLYLFNRGENLIAFCPLEEWLLHVREGAACPLPSICRVTLPGLKNTQAGFSGATLLPGTSSVIFTASVEHTENWIADGEVSGSFIGLMDLPAGEATPVSPVSRVIKGTDNRILQIKVESVAVADHPSPGQYRLLLVTDNDDGSSELIQAVVAIDKNR